MDRYCPPTDGGSGGRYRRLNRDFIFQSVHCAKRLLVATSIPFSARAASPPSGGKRLARTGEPDDLIREIHTRMPVILPEDKPDAWLSFRV